MSVFFDKLKERLFGSAKKAEKDKPQISSNKAGAKSSDLQSPAIQVEPKSTVEKKQNSKTAVSEKTQKSIAEQTHSEMPSAVTPTVAPKKAIKKEKHRSEAYFIQIGLDFGTAFCKCVCRDMLLDKAWVHSVPNRENTELPFLAPSVIKCDDHSLQMIKNLHGAYEENGLYHVKMALQRVGLEDWTAPVLQPFKDAAKKIEEQDISRFVGVCTIYLLAGVLGGIKSEIRSRYPGEVEGDYLAVNMAVPVADANHPKVNRLFDRALRLAWVLADDLAGYPDMNYGELKVILAKHSKQADRADIREACYIYPEVSANVQGFIRSRTSQQGLYLFSDTGAGTVDQSVFLFGRKDGQDHLTYLNAGVFPLGSSHLERLAAESDGGISIENLEHWRLKKESGGKVGPLQTAKRTIGVKLEKGTNQSVALAKKKLHLKRQINDLRVLFGGGGHSEFPYRSSVMSTFDGSLFHPEEIKGRKRMGESFDLGMPIPNDLSLQEHQRRWMPRLSVAYGLSFERGQLATFKLPKDVVTPTPQQVWAPRRRMGYAPTKDDV